MMDNSVVPVVTLFPLYARSVVSIPEMGLAVFAHYLTIA